MQNSITKSHDPNPSDNLESNNLRSQEYIANKSINPTLNYYELFVKCFEILNKSPEKRLPSELLLLEQLVENFGFFQKLLRKHPPLCNKLLRQIRIKLLKRGQTLFFAGDLPDNFYIILKGGVFILIPKDLDAMKLERNEETDRIKHFLLRLRTEKALSPFMKSKTTAIKRISISLLRSKSLYNDSKESFKGNMSHYYKKEVTMDFELKDFEKPWLYFEEGVFKYNCINVLNAGQSFGELGLLIKKPRNATILCKEDTQFLYLEKNDYMLLEQINRHKILKKLAFFSQFFFKNIVTNDYILKMIYNFQKKKFGYGQSLFKEEEEIDGCYIIKRGRVVVKKVALKLKDNSINPKENKLLEGNESILENKIRKKEKINNGIELGFFEKGQFIGEDDITQRKETRSYTAISKSADLTVFFIHKDLLLQILKDKPILQNFFLSLSNNKEFYLTNKILSVCESQNKLKSHKTKVKINEANYVRTEEEDINNIFYLSPQSTKMKSSYENLKNLKRNGVFGNLKSFHRNGGLLRGKLCEKIEDNYIEVNSIKTKNQKILDILSKNLGSQHKDPQSIFSHGFSDHSHHKSMIRSPFNKYNFIKIDILERKVIKTSDKKTKVPLLNKSEDGVSRLQRRIQSAMPTRGTSSHQRTQSNSIYQKKTVGGFITNSTQITRVHTRCQSSKGFVENGGKIENELINFCNLAVKKEGEKKDGIIHENMNVGKRRSLASSIHKTKHNMFYFTKKS